MTTAADVLHYLNTIAPPDMQESWDNCGLLCGRKDQEIKKILVALDPFRNVIQEAIAVHADLIVTHHPLIFGDGLKAVNDDTETGRNLLTLIGHGIAAINAHTNFDQAPGGVNDILAARLGLFNVRVIHPQGVDHQGRDWGLLRRGETRQQSLPEFLSFVKDALGCDGLRYVSGGRDVHQVAVGGGSCGSELTEVFAAGCDTFVTADVKYNQFRDALDLGVNLIDAGHFHTENPSMIVMADLLQEAFPETEVIFFAGHRDAMAFF